MTFLKRLIEQLQEREFGVDVAVRAPGRANLMGEHTDYNDGFVLPVALDLATYVVGRHRESQVRLSSLEVPETAIVDVTTGEGPTEGWGRYVTAVVRSLLEAKVSIGGLSGAIGSSVPIGSGLSSSAALEVALVHALIRQDLDPVDVAAICQRAENHHVGVRSGIMDQLASAAGRKGHALLIDCRSTEITHVALPPDLAVLVIDSAVRRQLGDSAYNQRRAECEEAATTLGLQSLRDATLQELEAKQDLLSDTAYRRAHHVLTENERVLATVEAFRAGDMDAIGRLFAAGHESLARDYEVSTPELDELVSIARSTRGIVAARLTGAGFGGCTVNLVARDRAQEAATTIEKAYRAATGLEACSWVSGAAEGAGPEPVETG